MKTLLQQAHILESINKIRGAKTSEEKEIELNNARYVMYHLGMSERIWKKIEAGIK